jgi:ribonucleoside-triphosphate reductase
VKAHKKTILVDTTEQGEKMKREVQKRDGRIVRFNSEKIADAIFKAALACGGTDRNMAEGLADKVVALLDAKFVDKTPHVEEVQDMVEKVLIEEGHYRTAKAYILYRQQRKRARDMETLVGDTTAMFSNYLRDLDWGIKENANMQKSVNGLNNYIREAFTKRYWLHEIYPEEVRDAHVNGDIHLHDLGFFGPYCAGWDLRQLLTDGFGGVEGKVESKPANHLRSFLGQVVNSTFTTQGETAGAQAWSSFDTYCAPFIRKDNMTDDQIKQCLQEFVFNINVPTRVGFQCPFSNITLDIKVPSTLRNEPVIMGGKQLDTVYGDYQAEMDRFNLAFCEVMTEGDAKGRVFTFPIPTINITSDFDWDSPVTNAIMRMTCKYGIPYFANYINSDLSPEDAISMCCRLRLDTKSLRKRGGGLFGSNPLTGSIGIVTINLPRIGYLAHSEAELFDRIKEMAILGKNSLEIKRKIIEDQSNHNLYPYSTHYLRHVKERTGQYWFNHFNTIGIVGMNEMLVNFKHTDMTTPEGQEFSIRVLNFLRDLMLEFQEETGHMYNLEATPAEGTSHRFARLDKDIYKDLYACGESDSYYYTNSTQLPVKFTDDIMLTVSLQDEVQSLYTGGTVQHFYLGERVEDPEVAKTLIRKIFRNSKMPYISITPTFSVCNTHGYIAGEHFNCPTCNAETEVYSRVTGYLRPVKNFNKGKKAEYMDRKKYVIKKEQLA